VLEAAVNAEKQDDFSREPMIERLHALPSNRSHKLRLGKHVVGFQ
jgi:hypothetical protein